MRKLTLPLLASLLVIGSATAQDKEFNRWALEANAGFAKPARTGGEAGETFKNVHFDGGVRYSLNNKFGLKGSFGIDRMNEWEGSNTARTNYYRTSLEAVFNLGRVLNFENWTSMFNVQAHAGGGYSWMQGGNFSGTDSMGHVMAGITGQLKVHPRVSLNADFTVIQNIGQDIAWDGLGQVNRSIAQGTMFNASVGVSFYLGKHAQHADWYAEPADRTLIDDLTTRITAVEGKLVDTDGDGVADYLDLELDTPAGALVDSRGRNIDLNNNGIADNIEAFVAEKYGNLDSNKVSVEDNEVIKALLNKGYLAAYFDFDKSEPTGVEGVNFIVTYLKNNPSASVDVIGYADKVGNTSYNNTLSQKRAQKVKDIIVKAGIDASRVNAKGAGIDNVGATKLARKVLFEVK